MTKHITNHSTSGDKSNPSPAEKKRIAIFGSCGGSNALKIIQYFKDHPIVQVALILSDRKDSGILDHARYNKIPNIAFSMADLNENRNIYLLLHKFHIDFIVLAGFLKLIPEHIIKSYEKKIVNIHPALLPKYGGKGMYGMNVHKAVKSNGDKETGITIHYVNKAYDEGAIITQKRVDVTQEDTPESIAHKVHQLEHKHFAPTIEKLLSEKEVSMK